MNRAMLRRFEKLPRYQNTVSFIAFNDEVEEINVRQVASFISVITASEAFEVKASTIARDVVALRKREAGS